MSEEMLRNLGGEIKQVLSELANGLGVAAEYVFGVLIRQQIANGIGNIFTALFFIVLCTVVLKVYTKRVLIPTLGEYTYSGDKKLLWYLDHQGAAIGFGIITGIILIVSLIVIPVCLIEGIQQLVNPEYYALKDIMKMINPPPVVK